MKTVQLTKEKFFVLSIQVLAALTLFLPFFSRSSFYFPFIAPRNFSFRILVELMALFYIFLVLENKEYLPRKNIVWILFLALLAVLTLSSVVNGDFAFSFWSNFERMDGLLGYYHQFAYFFVLYATLQKREAWETLFEVSMFAAFILSIVGVSQYVGVNLLLASSGGTRISSTIGNPTYFAAYLLSHIFLCAYFLLKKNFQNDRWKLYRFAFVALDAILIILHLRYASTGYRGILQLIFSNSGIFAPFAILHVFVYSQFIPYFRRENIFRAIHFLFYSVLAATFLFLITKTQTRGAIFGLGLGLFFIGINLLFIQEVKKFIRAWILALMVVIVLSVFWVLKNPEHPFVKNSPLLTKISSVTHIDRTTKTRYATWGAAVSGIREKPFLGWGAENFYRVFDRYFPPVIYEEETSVVWFDRPHNILLQFAIEGGIAALALYVLFLGALLYLLVRFVRENFIGLILSGFILSYIGQNLFVFDSINSYIIVFFTLAFCTFLVESKKSIPAFEKLKNSKLWHEIQQVKIGLSVACTALIFLIIWLVNIIPARSNQALLAVALQLNSRPSKDAMEEIFRVIENFPYLGKVEAISYAVDRVVNFIANKTFSHDLLVDYAQRTSNVVKTALEIDSHDVRTHLFAMVFYLNSGNINESYYDGVTALRDRAIALSPTRAQTHTVSGRAYVGKKMYDKAVEDFTRAVEIAPWVFEPRWDLFRAYISLKQEEKAREQIPEILKIFEKGRTLQLKQFITVPDIFTKLKFYDEAERALKIGIDKFIISEADYKKTAVLYIMLADVYTKQGKEKAADEAIKKALEINPSLGKDIEEDTKQILQ